jgi:HEAT repeat protein
MYQKKIVETLSNLMGTGDEIDRYYATKLLGSIGDIHAIPTLIERLHDDDIDVSIEAATALGKIGHSDAVAALLESLTNDPNGEIKTTVVEALGKIGGQAVIAPFLELAQSCPDNLVWDETEDWNAWWDMQLIAVKALGHQRVTEALPVLTNILIDEENQDIENEVLTALAHIGGEGEQILIQRLTQGQPRERRRAAMALGVSQSTEAHNALIQALTDKAAEVRIAVLQTLGKQGAEAYLDMILLFLKDPEPEVRQAALKIITDLPNHQDNAEIRLAKLTPLLEDSNSQIRVATLKALHNIKTIPSETLEKIHFCLSDSHNEVIAEASLLLAHLHDHTILPTLLQILSEQKRDMTLRSQIARALGILGNWEAISILNWAIKDEAQPVRIAALNALMQLEKPSTSFPSPNELPSPTPLEVIITILKGNNQNTLAKKSEPSENVGYGSTKPSSGSDTSLSSSSTLSSASNATAKEQPPLSDNQTPDIDSSDQEPHYAKSTLEAIAMDKVQTSLRMNEATLTDPLSNHNHFSNDIQEYIKIAQDNIELGERLFISKPVDVATDIRHFSARILSESNRAETVTALNEVLFEDDPILCREAVNALGQIAHRFPNNNIKELHQAFDRLITLLKIGDPEMRLACARTLGQLKEPLAIPFLFQNLHDEEASVRVQAIQSLTALIPTVRVKCQQPAPKISTKEAEMEALKTETILGQFMELLYDNNITVRKTAADALAELKHREAIDFIINSALRSENANEMGQALRLLDVEQSSMKLLDELTKAPNSQQRRIVIEILESVISQDFKGNLDNCLRQFPIH